MAEYTRLLEDLSGWPEGPTRGFPEVVRREARRRTSRRVAAGFVSLVVAAAGIGFAGNALWPRSAPASSLLSSTTVNRLRVAWTGSVGQGASGAVLGAREVVVGTANGSALAFDASCSVRPCLPSWFASSGSLAVHVTTSNGLVVESGRALLVLREGCAAQGRSCTPVWTSGLSSSGHPFSAPTVSDGVVYVGTPEGTVLAYSMTCATAGATCTPLWTGRTGSAAAVSRPAIAGGYVFVVSDRLYAFPLTCRDGAGTCSPAWSADVGRVTEANAPAVGDGIVAVAADRVSAFEISCASAGGICPAWTYAPGDGMPLPPPSIKDGMVYLGGSRVRALAVRCASGGRACSPLWQGPMSSARAFSEPTVTAGMVFASTDRVYAFRQACASACSPVWVGPSLGAGASTPAVGRFGVFVTTSDGTLYAFSLDGREGP